ncbi:putative ubiquitin-conjugating enzyme E2 25 [Camellia lanceoleosa]|uniref:Ubiquitin-conjugating enzyme E2 25 n=1 Tax=Camellia lanceoleosa TaxID=1840588 RepID=A0ACC0FX11_9ERIC|nr:putative ubiquitin-conjugating enzyme E2 25 [Camellia lanceoleosa]
MQGWRILQENLPKSIYVYAFESKIDLLKAVIVGAARTPYHHGLLFFNLSFLSTYPTSPPQVHYHSHGLRMNPNLYTNGYVCLSLINTWECNNQERRDHSISTILQVLHSLQALVLNEEPYINEPGYEKSNPKYNQVDSMTYSNNVFILSCKTMQYLIKKLPTNFETFVVSHFRSCGSLVLRACNAYREGRERVGCYKSDESSSSSSLTDVIEISSKFKEDMDLIYPKLVEAFIGIGASMEDMNELKKVSPNKRKLTEKISGRKSVKKIKKS